MLRPYAFIDMRAQPPEMFGANCRNEETDEPLFYHTEPGSRGNRLGRGEAGVTRMIGKANDSSIVGASAHDVEIVSMDVEHPEASIIEEIPHPGIVLGLDYCGDPGVHRLVSGGGRSVKIWTGLGLGGQRG